MRPRLTYANIMATVAVFLALVSGAYAATQLPKNSVGTKQLKNGAVTGAKVKPGSLKADAFAAGQLPSGPQGPTGVPGPRGDAGRSALETLRSEETVHGVWSLVGREPGGGISYNTTSPTFPIPAPQPVNSEHVVVAGNDSVSGDGCIGSAAEPFAAPGFVCIYSSHASGTTAAEGLGALAKVGAPSSTDGSKFGFAILVEGEETWVANGAWAYTAP